MLNVIEIYACGLVIASRQVVRECPVATPHTLSIWILVLDVPHAESRHWSCVEIPGALFVFAFDGIPLGIHFDRVEFIEIEEDGMVAGMFESRKTIEGRINRELRGLVLKRAFHW